MDVILDSADNWHDIIPTHTQRKVKTMKHPRKGVAGKSTGGKARAAIRSAKKRGATNASIGRATKRSASTIAQIASGDIKNPPKGLAANVRKAKATKKKGKK